MCINEVAGFAKGYNIGQDSKGSQTKECEKEDEGVTEVGYLNGLAYYANSQHTQR